MTVASELQVGFQQMVYPVLEDDQIVVVCAELIGSLEREISVLITTSEATASKNLLCIAIMFILNSTQRMRITCYLTSHVS